MKHEDKAALRKALLHATIVRCYSYTDKEWKMIERAINRANRSLAKGGPTNR